MTRDCFFLRFFEVRILHLDLPALLSALADNVDLYLASDGGAIPLKGSFGAVLATDDAILVECGGRA
jgi:hypothetical protein